MFKNILPFRFLSHILTNIHTQSIFGLENTEIYAHVRLGADWFEKIDDLHRVLQTLESTLPGKFNFD